MLSWTASTLHEPSLPFYRGCPTCTCNLRSKNNTEYFDYILDDCIPFFDDCIHTFLIMERNIECIDEKHFLKFMRMMNYYLLFLRLL